MSNPDLRYETVTVPGLQALDELQSLRTGGGRSGYFAVLMGDEEDAGNIPGMRSSEEIPDIGTSVHLAESLNLEEWMQKRVDEEPDSFETDEEGEFQATAGGQPGITAHMNLGRKASAKDEVLIAKIPAPVSWQIPIYLGFGGWNDCPGSVELAAASKSWNERFGAEIVACTGDTLEYAVARPPASESDCRALAREHFIVCSDVVHQGVGTLTALASSLSGSPTWYFWWD